MRYRVGIIGCGQIASTFEEDEWREHPCTHAGAYKAVKETEIVAAADINQDRLSTFSKKWGVKSVYEDYNEMLENEVLDIVSVTANTPMHCEITIKAAKAGVKAIFCEKPIATCLEEADEMVRVCDKRNVKIIINHTRRWDSCYQKAKELVNKGGIGDLTSVTGYFTSGLLIMGTHLFDLFRFLAGDVECVVAKLEGAEGVEKYKKTDPSGSGFVRFKNGVVGSVIGSSKKEYLLFEIDLQGTRGRVIVKDNGRTFELWTPDKRREHVDFNTPNELVLENSPQVERGRKNSLIAAVEDVVRAVEQGKEGLCTGRDGRAALELALAFHKSSQEGGEKISLPLNNKKLRVISR